MRQGRGMYIACKEGALVTVRGNPNLYLLNCYTIIATNSVVNFI